MKILPRSLNFMWRLMHNSLLIKTNIQRREIRCDLVCPRCSMREESEAHLFSDCDWASRFWFVSPFNLRTEAAAEMPLLEWVSATLNQIDKERNRLFICCLHGLWHGRNKLLFENENLAPKTLLERAVTSFAEALPPTNSPSSIKEPPLGSQSLNDWRMPPSGKYKINVDATNNNGVKGGVGVVIRDSNGVVAAAATLKVAPSFSIREAEAFAFYQGLNIAAQAYFFGNRNRKR